ncbi:hypothetical protein QOL99_03445 [Deinococcus sp. MIMF12]|uniref:ATP-binding protein n=1 Tax=Deinococcus rhizophilus TaxID=3049544 RepID=A0ABT7JDR2_9DEIO|nr:hypothetical protein [Deinococcus rhizophilus]MDL2343199.1 hypothetical protein [Deinococcus rhizophilus]
MRPFVFHLAGPPGSGKRTVGEQLARLTGAVLLDNHLFRDAVYRPYGADGVRPIPPELQDLGSQVWALGLQAARLAPRDVSQIFTAYHPDRESSRASAGRIRGVAVDRDATYVPVWLKCDLDELARRMTLPERSGRAKMCDPERLRKVLGESGVLPPPPGAIVLDTARLAPADAALLIAAHAGALS